MIIKHIFTWLGSGFFRKLGSILCYLIIGTLLIAFLSSRDIKLPKLFNHMYVKAYQNSGYGSAQYMDVTIPLVDSYGCFLNDTETSSSWYNFGTEHTFGNRRFIKITRAMINSGSYTWTTDNTYTFRFTLALNPKDYQNFKNNSNLRWRIEGSTSTNSSGLSSSNIVANSSIVTYGNYDNNNYWIYYDITFTPAQNLKLIWIQFDWSGSVQVGNNSCVGNSHPRALPGYNFVDFQWYRIDYVRYVPTNNWENVNQSINSQTTIIENNFSQTNENINNINNSLNDTDTTDSEDIASDFIDDFSSESDNFITNLITLPFNFLQTLIIGSDQDLCFTLKGVTSCLPNGQKTIWNKDFSGHSSLFAGVVNNTSRDTFKTFFNLVVAGYLSYKMIIMLIHKVHEWITPDKSVVEVMDL